MDVEWLAQFARVEQPLCFDVPWIETAHEADHRHLCGPLLSDGDDALAVGDFECERLLTEHVFAGLQHRNDLIGVQRRRSDQPHGLELRMSQQRRQVLVDVGYAVGAQSRLAATGSAAATRAAPDGS